MNDAERERIRAIYNDLYPQLPEKPVFDEGALRHRPPGSPEESWKTCTRLVEDYDADMCKAYREQIDTLMVFAGLFSGVVTAFSVESYQWLRTAPGDRSAEMLAQIVTLLAQNNQSSSSLVTLSSGSATDSETTPPASTAARINVYWFLSLTVSLSAALIGILCKQWLREYERTEAGTGQRRSLSIRHMKFKGLLSWRVGSIVDSMPIILQLALILFLLGIIELLHALNSTVAVPVIIAVALLLAFYVATTLAPAFLMVFFALNSLAAATACDFFPRLGNWSHCPYKSPQAWLVLRVTHAIMWPLVRTLRKVDKLKLTDRIPRRFRSWREWDMRWVFIREQWFTERIIIDPTAESIISPTPVHDGGLLYWVDALKWMALTFRENATHIDRWIWHCLVGADENIASVVPRTLAVKMEFLTDSRLEGREWMEILAEYRGGTPLYLQDQMIALAFTATADGGLDSVIELFARIATGEVDPGMMWTVRCLRQIMDQYARRPRRNCTGVSLAHDLCYPLSCLAERRMDPEVRQPSAHPDVIQSLLVDIVELLSSSDAPAEIRFQCLGHVCYMASMWLMSATRHDGTGLVKNWDISTLKKCARAGLVVLLEALQGYHSRLFPVPGSPEAEHWYSMDLIRTLALFAKVIADVWPPFYTVDWDSLPDDPEFRSTYFESAYEREWRLEGLFRPSWRAGDITRDSRRSRQFRLLVDFGRAVFSGPSDGDSTQPRSGDNAAPSGVLVVRATIPPIGLQPLAASEFEAANGA